MYAFVYLDPVVKDQGGSIQAPSHNQNFVIGDH